MENQYKMNGKKAVSSLRALAIKHQVRLVDAFLLADLHPSNLTRWSKEIHKARVSHVKDVEAAIELLSEDRILTLRLNPDVLEALKKHANKSGFPYQTFISSLLIQAVGKPSVDARLESIENELKKLTD